MPKYNRTIDLATLQDPNQIDSVEYNWQSGGKKVLHVGPHLLPIQVAAGWTTNVTTAVALPKVGMNLAIYNNAGAVGSITIGGIGTASQAVGVVDSNGNVGVACPPNEWTYLSMGNNQYVVSSAATLIVYLLDDSTSITRES